MFELIYCSIAQPEITIDDINAILKTSREHNYSNAITGCLLYFNHEFIQVLEGERKVVEQLFSRIEKDKRHSSVILLAAGEKEKRIFDNWSMAFYGINSVADIGEYLFKENILAFSEFTEQPTHAVKLFWYMAKQMLQE